MGQAHGTVRRRGSARFDVSPNAAGRRLVRRAPASLELVLIVMFTPSDGNPRTVRSRGCGCDEGVAARPLGGGRSGDSRRSCRRGCRRPRGGRPVYLQVPGSPFASVTENLWSGAFSPTGTLFVTGNFFDNEITMFRVNQATGALSVVGQTGLGSQPNAVQFAKHSSATFLGVITDDAAALFSVSSSGKLTQLGMPSSVPDGRRLSTSIPPAHNWRCRRSLGCRCMRSGPLA